MATAGAAPHPTDTVAYGLAGAVIMAASVLAGHLTHEADVRWPRVILHVVLIIVAGAAGAWLLTDFASAVFLALIGAASPEMRDAIQNSPALRPATAGLLGFLTLSLAPSVARRARDHIEKDGG
jgi:hypothetical protein